MDVKPEIPNLCNHYLYLVCLSLNGRMHVRVCLCVFTAICLERETRVLGKALRTAKAVYPVTDLWGVGAAWLRAGAAEQHGPAHPP